MADPITPLRPIPGQSNLCEGPYEVNLGFRIWVGFGGEEEWWLFLVLGRTLKVHDAGSSVEQWLRH